MLRRESVPPVGRGLLRGPSAEVVLFVSRESPPAADRGALRNSLPPSVREVLRGPPCAGVRLEVREPPLADCDSKRFDDPVMTAQRMPSHG